MINRILFSLLFTCVLQYAQAQPIKFGIRTSLSTGGTFYDANTRNYFDNDVSATLASFLNYKNIFAGMEATKPFSRLRNNILLNDVMYAPSEQLAMDIHSWVIGYSFRSANQRIALAPYLGAMKTYIENHKREINYASQYGSCIGAFMYFYPKTERQKGPFVGQWFWVIHNRLGFPQLTKLNAQLGNLQYSIEIGFGYHWGSIKDYWRGR